MFYIFEIINLFLKNLSLKLFRYLTLSRFQPALSIFIFEYGVKTGFQTTRMHIPVKRREIGFEDLAIGEGIRINVLD